MDGIAVGATRNHNNNDNAAQNVRILRRMRTDKRPIKPFAASFAYLIELFPKQLLRPLVHDVCFPDVIAAVGRYIVFTLMLAV